MKKCKECGGEIVLKNGSYRCKYCGAEFEEQSFVSQKVETVNRTNEGVDVFQKNIHGVLEIECVFGNSVSAGSGLLISQDGFALTNTHVVTNDAKPCANITVRIAGQRVGAEIIKLGDDNGGHGNGVDLALIKLDYVPRNATIIEMGDFSKVRTGEQVFVIGNSLGDGTCITSGIVSDKRRVLSGKTLMMTDCAINGGNSGGPIFNKEGLAIGVIVSSRIKSDGTATEGMNYAIPMDIVMQFLAERGSITRQTGGQFERPTKRTLCVFCGKIAYEGSAGNCWCDECGRHWNKSIVKTSGSFPPITITRGERRPALCPCPRCHSKEHAFIENGLFVCDNCGFVEGDKP